MQGDQRTGYLKQMGLAELSGKQNVGLALHVILELAVRVKAWGMGTSRKLNELN